MESNITVINRTAEKVELISKDLDIPLKIKSYKEINNIISDIDLIVNTTSLGMKDNHNIEIDFDKSKANLHVYDLIYNPQQTKLLIDAEMSGCTYQNGLDMLVHQAAESFFIWHGIYPTINEEIFSIIRELK
jgi:shikimate dehydrogenase